jgi:hypothetical protein
MLALKLNVRLIHPHDFFMTQILAAMCHFGNNWEGSSTDPQSHQESPGQPEPDAVELLSDLRKVASEECLWFPRPSSCFLLDNSHMPLIDKIFPN